MIWQFVTGAPLPPALPVGASLVQMLITGSRSSLATWSSCSPTSPALFCIVGMIYIGTLQVPQDTAWPYILAGSHRVSSNTSDVCKLLRKSVSCPRHEAMALHIPRLHRIWLQGLRVSWHGSLFFPIETLRKQWKEQLNEFTGISLNRVIGSSLLHFLSRGSAEEKGTSEKKGEKTTIYQ